MSHPINPGLVPWIEGSKVDHLASQLDAGYNAGWASGKTYPERAFSPDLRWEVIFGAVAGLAWQLIRILRR